MCPQLKSLIKIQGAAQIILVLKPREWRKKKKRVNDSGRSELEKVRLKAQE